MKVGGFRSDEVKFEASAGGVVSAKCDGQVAGIVGSGRFFIEVKLETTTKGTIGGASVVAVALDRKLKSVILKESPGIRLARGTEKVVEDTMTVEHSLTISNRWKVEADVKAAVNGVWASLKVHVRGEIEKSTKKTYKEKTERKRSVTLKGDGSSGKVKVVWVEYYRTGTATLRVDGKEYRVPFEFKDDFDLLTEDADS
jgi:hypothetical protein